MITFAEKEGLPNITYGRAAKLIAIYLKNMIINGPDSKTIFADLIHPPIDRILLKELAQCVQYPKDIRKSWRSINWTTCDETNYFKLISSLRTLGLDKPAFWRLESYWDVMQMSSD